jgi:hypothetical protein
MPQRLEGVDRGGAVGGVQRGLVRLDNVRPLQSFQDRLSQALPTSRTEDPHVALIVGSGAGWPVRSSNAARSAGYRTATRQGLTCYGMLLF